MMNFIKKNLPGLALGLLIVVSLCVRLYNLRATQTFLEDEGRDLLIAMRMIDTARPVLLGPQTSIGSMYLGPFYYYFITPALMIARMDPIGPAVLVALTGAVTVYLMYRVGKRWFGTFAGYSAATLYAFMPLPVNFTRNSWNPNLAPLVSLLILYVLDKLRVVDKNNLKWFGVLGLLTGILVQLHYMGLIFVGIYGLILLLWWGRTKLIVKAILWALLGFALALLPFIIFELRNDWVNTQAIIRFIEARESPNIRYALPLWLWWTKVSSVSLSLFGGLFGRASFRPFDPLTVPITFVAVATSLVGIVVSKIDVRRKVILGATVFGSVAILGIYQENIHVHYLGYLFTLAYLAFVSLIAHPHKLVSTIGIGSTALVLAYGIPTMAGNISSPSNNQVTRAREVAAYIQQKAAGRPYNIVSSRNTSTSPYQYFSFLTSNPPTNEWADTIFLICQGELCSEGDIHNKQLFLIGPAHPSLGNYVGHPLANDLGREVKVENNEHVSNGVWVAQLTLLSNNK